MAARDVFDPLVFILELVIPYHRPNDGPVEVEIAGKAAHQDGDGPDPRKLIPVHFVPVVFDHHAPFHGADVVARDPVVLG